MIRSYLIYTIFLGLALTYANAYGWRFVDVFVSGKWGPHMQANHYHK